MRLLQVAVVDVFPERHRLVLLCLRGLLLVDRLLLLLQVLTVQD